MRSASSATARHFNLCSLGLDSRGLDEGPPLLDLRLVMRAERSSGLLVWRRDVLAQVLEPLANGGVRKRFDHRRIELRDGGGGRTVRNPYPVPNRHVEPRQPGLVNGGDLWRRGEALRRGHGECLDLAGL